MSRRGVDFSYDKPDGKALKAAGFSFVVGYVSGDAGKDISASQAATYRKDGVAVHFVYEGTGREALSESGLRQHIVNADKLMVARGASADEPLFVAVDFQPSSSQIVAMSANLASAKTAVARKVGYYGNYSLIKYCMDHGMEVAWQTYAWSSGNRDVRAQFYQYSNNHHAAGGTVDYDTQYHDVGTPVATPPAKPPVTTPPKLLPTFPLPTGEFYGVDDHTKWSHSGAQAKDQANIKLIQAKVAIVKDGDFGPGTAAAVRVFQKDHKLTPDGRVGPDTWKTLGL